VGARSERPVASRPVVLGVLAVAIAGCGGNGHANTQADPETTPPATSTAIDARPLDRLSDSLRRAAAIADSEDCGRSGELKRLSRRIRRQATAVADTLGAEAGLQRQVAAVQQSVDEAQTSLSDIVRACADQKELQDAAKQARQDANQIDKLGEP
jgi:hypothetical protein